MHQQKWRHPKRGKKWCWRRYGNDDNVKLSRHIRSILCAFANKFNAFLFMLTTDSLAVTLASRRYTSIKTRVMQFCCVLYYGVGEGGWGVTMTNAIGSDSTQVHSYCDWLNFIQNKSDQIHFLTQTNWKAETKIAPKIQSLQTPKLTLKK